MAWRRTRAHWSSRQRTYRQACTPTGVHATDSAGPPSRLQPRMGHLIVTADWYEVRSLQIDERCARGIVDTEVPLDEREQDSSSVWSEGWLNRVSRIWASNRVS